MFQKLNSHYLYVASLGKWSLTLQVVVQVRGNLILTLQGLPRIVSSPRESWNRTLIEKVQPPQWPLDILVACMVSLDCSNLYREVPVPTVSSILLGPSFVEFAHKLLLPTLFWMIQMLSASYKMHLRGLIFFQSLPTSRYVYTWY